MVVAAFAAAVGDAHRTIFVDLTVAVVVLFISADFVGKRAAIGVQGCGVQGCGGNKVSCDNGATCARNNQLCNGGAPECADGLDEACF